MVVEFSTNITPETSSGIRWCAYSNWDCSGLSPDSLLIPVMKPKTKIQNKDSFYFITLKFNFSTFQKIIMKVKIISCFLLLSLCGAISDAFAQLQPTTYYEEKQHLNGLLAVPKSPLKEKNGVLILPAWMGIDKHASESAEQLAKLGYYTFVADIYGEGNVPKNTAEAGKLAGYYKSHVDEYRKRIQLALDQLLKAGANPDKIAVIGYCFGGTGALEAARANMNVKGVVSFHGGLSRDTTKTTTSILPKVLVCHGADDFFIPQDEIISFQQEMRTGKADWQMNYYADAVHSFTDPTAGNDPTKGVAYNEKAAKRSWKAMLDFFEELFK